MPIVGTVTNDKGDHKFPSVKYFILNRVKYAKFCCEYHEKTFSDNFKLILRVKN